MMGVPNGGVSSLSWLSGSTRLAPSNEQCECGGSYSVRHFGQTRKAAGTHLCWPDRRHAVKEAAERPGSEGAPETPAASVAARESEGHRTGPSGEQEPS